MNNPNLNQQDYIATKFQYMEDHIQQMSRLALLKLQSLHMIRNNRLMDRSKRLEMEDFVQTTLLNIVPNSHILSEEGFYFTELAN